MELSELEKITSKVRMDFEERKIDRNILKDLYQEYNPLEDVDSFVDESIKLFPHLNCGLSAIYLKKLLKSGKTINGKYNNNNHTFLLINDELVIDITADQYGGPKVYVGPFQSPWSL